MIYYKTYNIVYVVSQILHDTYCNNGIYVCRVMHRSTQYYNLVTIQALMPYIRHGSATDKHV